MGAACGRGEDRPGADGSASASASHVHETETTAFKLDQATAKVDVKAREYAFEGLPATVVGPRVAFTVANIGAEEHEFELIGADGEPVAEVHVAKGKTAVVTAKANPGAYTVVCMLKEGKKTHADLGMKASLTVT